jgi:hypothetical protein
MPSNAAYAGERQQLSIPQTRALIVNSIGKLLSSSQHGHEASQNEVYSFQG